MAVTTRSAKPARKTGSSPTFSYVAVGQNGSRVKSTMVATSRAAVVATLNKDGWVPISITESSSSLMNFDVTAAITGGGVKFKWQARSEFARRLHQMLRSGISQPAALYSLAESAKAAEAAMYTAMAEKVVAGAPLSEAMRDHPRAFDEVTVAYIDAGEVAGTIVDTVGRLATMLRKRAELSSKVKAVSAYPKMVGSAIGLLVAGILIFLVPQFAKIYESFHAELPAPTQFVVNASNHLSPFTISNAKVAGIDVVYPVPQPFSVGFIVGVMVFAVIWFRRRAARDMNLGMKVDKVFYRLPLVGGLAHKQALQRWSSTLAGGLASGVQIGQALELSAAASGSRWLRLITPELQEAVLSGRPLSGEVALHDKLFPPSVRAMLTTGEETGEVDSMLDSVAGSLDSDIDALVAGLAAKIEVALLLVMGVIVGGLLIVLYMPILGLAGAVSKGA